jgi:hypothetical protein
MSIIQSISSFFSGKPVRKFALKIDKPDSRDFHVDALLCTLTVAAEPTSGSVYDSRIVVKDQGSTGSCAGQSGANGLRAAYLAQGIDCPDLSAFFAYYGARDLEGTANQDEGAYLRDIVKTFQQMGECPESAWPFKESKVLTAPTWSAFRAAIPRRGLRGYYRIPTGMPSTVPTVKKLLAAKIPVFGGWQVNKSIMDAAKLTPQEACKPPYVGGHAMLIESFDGDIFTNLNSWGKSYRKGGRFLATRGFINSANDLWALDVRQS